MSTNYIIPQAVELPERPLPGGRAKTADAPEIIELRGLLEGTPNQWFKIAVIDSANEATRIKNQLNKWDLKANRFKVATRRDIVTNEKYVYAQAQA